MIYSYVCPKCNKEHTITKPMAEVDRVEYCEICESELKRVYQAGMIKTGDGVKQ